MKKNLYNEFNFGSEHNISSQLLSINFFGPICARKHICPGRCLLLMTPRLHCIDQCLFGSIFLFPVFCLGEKRFSGKGLPGHNSGEGQCQWEIFCDWLISRGVFKNITVFFFSFKFQCKNMHHISLLALFLFFPTFHNSLYSIQFEH